MAGLNFTAGPAPRRNRSAAEELERARGALFALDAGCDRDGWVRIGMAAKAAGLEEGDFVDWSSAGANFAGERDCRSVWRSICTDGGIQAGTLFALARDAGWRDEAAPRINGHHGRPNKPPAPASQPPAGDCAAVWRDAEPATAEHPYVARKLGLPFGLRVYHGPRVLAGQPLDGALLVPAYDAGGALQSWQAIPAGDGKKLNAPGVSMTGARFIVGGQLRDGDPAYLCEGVATAWSSCQASGKPAICCFGAGNVERVAADLRARHPGVRLVVVADRGKEADAERIARRVGGAWVAMPEDWSANADVNDVHARDGLDAVAALLAQAREPERPEPRYRLLTAEDLAALPPVRWRVRGVLPADGLAAVYGPPGSGKSFLALDLLGAVAEGRDWFGHRTSPAPVVYVALEGEAGIAQRVQAYRSRHGQAPADMRFVAQSFALLEPGDVAELAEAVRAASGAGGVVAIDTLNRASPGADENDSRDMGQVIAGAKLLQAALGGLVLLMHHSGKDASRGLRGHSSLLAVLDAAIEVTREGDRREWRTSKAKDGPDGEAHPFRLDVVELGTDEDGEPVTSCVVTPEAAGASRPTAPAGGNQRIAWDRIGEILREAGDGRPSDAPAELPPGRPVVTLEAAIEAVAGRLVCDPKRRRERATEAIRGLCGRRLLHHVEGWLWCA